MNNKIPSYIGVDVKDKSEISMKQNFSYKNIHIGAIATFYIIALLVRLVSLYVVDKFPSIETNYALQVCAALATRMTAGHFGEFEYRRVIAK